MLIDGSLIFIWKFQRCIAIQNSHPRFLVFVNHSSRFTVVIRDIAKRNIPGVRRRRVGIGNLTIKLFTT